MGLDICLMRSLYWKIFISFWLASLLIIFTTAWVTGYRFVAVNDHPISYFIQVPWLALSVRLVLAIVISALICYLLSIYLTQPLRLLRMAARQLATGQLDTRVGRFRGHYKDEIAELSDDFNIMAEQLENLISSKERLLQDISHELRSPLARLNIAIELGKTKTHPVAEKEFNRMEIECLRLNALIGEILDFARLDKSTSSLDLTQTNMTQLLTEIIHDANYEFGSNLERVKAGTIEPCTILIDQRLVQRGIENIVRNALHYSPADKPVTLSLHYIAAKDQIQIDIKDHGPGVPTDQLEKIFNPFYRVDTARTKRTGGYGLGLAIASQAINLHHGQLFATNNIEGGLLVRMILPCR